MPHDCMRATCNTHYKYKMHVAQIFIRIIWYFFLTGVYYQAIPKIFPRRRQLCRVDCVYHIICVLNPTHWQNPLANWGWCYCCLSGMGQFYFIPQNVFTSGDLCHNGKESAHVFIKGIQQNSIILLILMKSLAMHNNYIKITIWILCPCIDITDSNFAKFGLLIITV